jgi:hypothetical protein
VSGLPAAEAKNEAVRIAMGEGRDLLLIEDDITADARIWDLAMSPANHTKTILFAAAPCRNGQWNLHSNREGMFLFSGTVMLRVSIDLLREMTDWGKRSIFAPARFSFDLSPIGWHPDPRRQATKGHGSDLRFWWQVGEMDPQPRIVCLGAVTHWRYQAQEDYDLGKPVRMAKWEPTTPYEKFPRAKGIEYAD